MDYFIKSYKEIENLLIERYFNKRRGEWVFRGVSDVNFKLIPSVARIKHTSISFEKFEISIFEMFKRYAIQYINNKELNDYEWLALAQHHGLPTRLLDWTLNPNIALFFVCKENFNSDGFVYALKASKKLSNDKIKSISPFKLEKSYKFLAPTVSKRIFHQDGLFTISVNPLIPLDSDLRKDWQIDKILIPKEIKQKILYKLFRLGIDESKLFPDLDGLARHLKWQHSINSSL